MIINHVITIEQIHQADSSPGAITHTQSHNNDNDAVDSCSYHPTSVVFLCS